MQLQTLNLGNNKLKEIHSSMWVGLQSLISLSLKHDYLTQIPRHGLSHLHRLRTLDLSHNYLTTLRADIFNPDDFPDSNGRPASLDLKLNGNVFVCNPTMCWLIDGALSFGWYGEPTCANYNDIPLSRVQINCISGNI